MIYLSTFSKTLAPGFRVGWMVAPAALIERFETAKQSVDLMTGILDQRDRPRGGAARRARAARAGAARALPRQARRDGAGAARRSSAIGCRGRRRRAASSSGRRCRAGIDDDDAARARARAAAGVRHRQRVLRRRHRPRHDPAVVLGAVAGADRGRRRAGWRRRCKPATVDPNANVSIETVIGSGVGDRARPGDGAGSGTGAGCSRNISAVGRSASTTPSRVIVTSATRNGFGAGSMSGGPTRSPAAACVPITAPVSSDEHRDRRHQARQHDDAAERARRSDRAACRSASSTADCRCRDSRARMMLSSDAK